jgi:hypothetical protein
MAELTCLLVLHMVNRLSNQKCIAVAMSGRAAYSLLPIGRMQPWVPGCMASAVIK